MSRLGYTLLHGTCVLTPRSHILNAARHLRDLDQRQVDAVQARIESDLRTGYAFTRFLTNSLRSLGGPIQNSMISYGMFDLVCLFLPMRIQVNR